MNHTDQLVKYHAWANQKWIIHLKQFPKEMYRQKIESVFSSISETLEHMYLVDITWLGIMTGKSYEDIKKANSQLVDGIKEIDIENWEDRFNKLSECYQSFLESQESYNDMIFMKHPYFGEFEAKVSDLIQHVVNHGTYHRGNLSAMARQLGQTGVSTDFIFYLYENASDK